MSETITNGKHNKFNYLPFGTAPGGNIFQEKIDKLFNNIPNAWCIADIILITGFDANGRDHDEGLEQVLHRCVQVNLKLSKEKC